MKILEFSSDAIEKLYGLADVTIGEPKRRRATLFKVDTLGQSYMLRIFANGGRDNEAVRAHIALFGRLRSDGYTIEKPILSRDGLPSVLLLFERELRVAMLTPFHYGEMATLDEESAGMFGSLLGAFHSSNASLKVESPFDPIFNIDTDINIGIALARLANLETEARIEQLNRQIRNLLSPWRAEFLNCKPLKICHGDAWIGNMIRSNNVGTLVDFEEVCFGDSLYDIATFLWSIISSGVESPELLFRVFINNYQNEVRLSNSDKPTLMGFFLVRELRILRFLIELGIPRQMLDQHLETVLCRSEKMLNGDFDCILSNF